ncbi:hypothetical protein HKBW3S34_00803 [Candidatus Hakubella thermalkaliphila]|uniref:Uncharacterized protein n=1 Tax=Candidatus Hakubella thermalkaliphila TaxID=2754717 RepID=A0A6V8PC22_9ACTN|nr:hypothetical protein HKBW3S34_00803 [Candidatus Hakubella thermalkaliphila]
MGNLSKALLDLKHKVDKIKQTIRSPFNDLDVRHLLASFSKDFLTCLSLGLYETFSPTAILKNLGSICRAISLIEPQHIVCIQVNDVVGLDVFLFSRYFSSIYPLFLEKNRTFRRSGCVSLHSGVSAHCNPIRGNKLLNL